MPDAPCDLLPALQRREGGAFGHAEALGGLEVEAAGALGLDQRVAVGAHAVGGLEGLDLVAVVGDRLARLQLDQLELEAEPADRSASAPRRARAGPRGP